MAVSIVNSQIAGAGAAAASITNNFSAQPDNGNRTTGAGGCWFMEGGSSLSYSAPASLTTLISAFGANPEMGGFVVYRTSNGSEGTAYTLDKSGTNRSMALLSVNLSGANDPDAYGSNSPTADGTNISVTTDSGADSGNVTANNSLAFFVVLRRSRNEGGSMSFTYSNSFSELGKAQALSNDSLTEIYVATKTVNSGSTVTCAWDTSDGTSAGLQAFLFVVPPSNSAPTVTAAATDDCVVGVNEDIGAVFTVADTDSNLDTIRYQCVAAHGDITVTLSGDVTVSAGTNGTDDFTITGSHANLLTVHATAVFNATTEDTQNITVTATDDEALSASDTVAMTSHYLRITNATQSGLNTTLGTGVAVNTDAETAFVDLIAEDSGGRQSTTATTSITTSETIVASGFSRTRRRRRR